MTRRWYPGWKGQVSGIHFRVVEGHKAVMESGEVDLRLEWFCDDRWLPVDMKAGALMADFFAENEEIRYPQRFGYRGGKYYLSYIKQAANYGWSVADRRLQAERRSLFESPDEVAP